MKVGCALLAAGAGKRFGGGKLLYKIDGEPMIKRALRLYAPLPFSARVCVTRAEAMEIRTLARQDGFAVALNPAPERGVGTSVAIATRELLLMEPELDGILYAVSDQPYLTQDSVKRLLDAFMKSPERIVSLGFGKRRGNPAIFPRELLSELSALSEDVGGGAVIRRHPDLLTLVDAEDEKELEDIDTRKHITQWDTFEQCALNAGLTRTDIVGYQRRADQEDVDAIETCLDILLNEFSKNGLDENSEPNAWGFTIEEAVSVFVRMLQRVNDKEND